MTLISMMVMKTIMMNGEAKYENKEKDEYENGDKNNNINNHKEQGNKK